jgi:hypothetical protein
LEIGNFNGSEVALGGLVEGLDFHVVLAEFHEVFDFFEGVWGELSDV